MTEICANILKWHVPNQCGVFLEALFGATNSTCIFRSWRILYMIHLRPCPNAGAASQQLETEMHMTWFLLGQIWLEPFGSTMQSVEPHSKQSLKWTSRSCHGHARCHSSSCHCSEARKSRDWRRHGRLLETCSIVYKQNLQIRRGKTCYSFADVLNVLHSVRFLLPFRDFFCPSFVRGKLPRGRGQTLSIHFSQRSKASWKARPPVAPCCTMLHQSTDLEPSQK